MDFADVGAEGVDVLDNFDFDSFLNKDGEAMGFDFLNFDSGLEGGVGRSLGHISQNRMDAETAPQHGQKRSHSDAILSSAKHTPSPRRKRRAVTLSPRTGEVCESSVEAAELPADSSKNEVPTDSLSGVEALLQRWLGASATAMFLRHSNGE